MRTLSKSVEKITEWVKKSLTLVNNGHPSQYLTVEVEDDNGDYAYAKIRVSNHSAKRTNNGDTFTLSFITQTCDQGFLGMKNEWLMEDENEMITNTYEYVSDIIDWELNNNIVLD